VAGGVNGVGGPVVLAGLPDDRVAVVLTGVVDGHPDPEGEGGLALLGVVVAEAMRAVGGHAELGVEPVKGPLGGPLAERMVVGVVPVAVVQLMGQIGVALGPGTHLRMLDGQVGDGVAVGPVPRSSSGEPGML
jgi:hypothetical protein